MSCGCNNLPDGSPISNASTPPVLAVTPTPLYNTLPPSDNNVGIDPAASYGGEFVSVGEARYLFPTNVQCKIEQQPAPEALSNCNLPSAPTPVCNGKTLSNTSLQGKVLDPSWMDTKDSESVTLLGRAGNRLANFVGEGYLYVKDGLTCVRQDVSLRATKLLHRWIVPTAHSKPIISDPLPAPYEVVAQTEGDIFLRKGLPSTPSFSLWNPATQMFEQTPVTNFPICKQGFIDRASELQLIGFSPIAPNTDPTATRCAKSLSGKGLVYVTEAPSVPQPVECDCAPQAPSQTTNVVRVAPFPNADGVFNVKVEEGSVLFVPAPVVENGQNGLSAYQLAVADGFSGTQSQWLASLQGAAGAAGQSGLSAFQIAADNGFTGTQTQWLASLRGSNGANGLNGVNGIDGLNGANGANGAAGASAYEVAVANGFIGSEAQWIASLNALPTVTLATTPIEVTKQVFAPIITGANGNQAGSVNFAGSSVSETPWTHGAGSNNFTLTGSFRRVEIVAHAHYAPSAGNTVGLEDVSPVLELWRNGVTLLATCANGFQRHANDASESSNTLTFHDMNPGTNPSYSIISRQEGRAGVVPIAAGYFSGVAVQTTQVVTGVTLS